MNKEQFLKKLDQSLKGISVDERTDIIRDFEEHFASGLEEGKTEEEIANSLGSIERISKELLASHRIKKVKDNGTIGNILQAVWAVIGLGLFNFIIVLGPFIALVGVVFAGWFLGASFVVSPVLVLVNAMVHPDTFALFDLFFSILLAAFGFFIALGMFFATRGFVNIFVRYLQFNMKLVKGGIKK